jgi:hypothetical protein
VVRVLIPGLAPNFPSAFLPLGMGRLLASSAAEGLNLFPMPYA